MRGRGNCLFAFKDSTFHHSWFDHIEQTQESSPGSYRRQFPILLFHLQLKWQFAQLCMRRHGYSCCKGTLSPVPTSSCEQQAKVLSTLFPSQQIWPNISKNRSLESSAILILSLQSKMSFVILKSSFHWNYSYKGTKHFHKLFQEFREQEVTVTGDNTISIPVST